MIRHLIAVVAAVLFFITSAGYVLAADKGNARKGKHVFRTTCRACHKEGESATPLNPDSKTQAQWARAFRKDKYEEYECKDEWAKLSDKDLLDILTYLDKHAYDSPQPAKCK